MLVRKTLVLLVALCALCFLVACGGSSSPAATPPPSGGFSASNLSGTYVFSSTGLDASGDLITMVGSLAASGGNITGGTVDIFSVDAVAAAQPITGGNYKITSDGRGQINFNVTVTTPSTGATQAVTFTLDLVLMSNSHGFVTEYDVNGTGSGTIDLQTTVSQAQLAGAFAFGVSGTGTSGSPISTVGNFTLGDTGTVTAAGTEDVNNAGAYSNGSITTASTVSVGATPGAASLVSSLGTTYAFDVYPIDTTHFKLIETDGLLITSGDAYTQATSLPTGQLVYTMQGEDTSGLPLGLGGYLTNSSDTISAGLEDFNDGGTLNTTTAVTGSFTALTGGRSVLTLGGFVNGAASDVPGTYAFAAYPFTYSGGTGVQLLEIDTAGITAGTAYPQAGTPGLPASQGYGLNLSATNIGGGSGAFFEEDDIAEFTTTSSGLSGIVDVNDEGQLTFGKAFTGNFATAIDSNGRGAVTANAFDYEFYFVNSSTFLILESDSTQIGTGAFELQSATGSAAAIEPASLIRLAPRAHNAKQKKTSN
jgi:hypothetical protein